MPDEQNFVKPRKINKILLVGKICEKFIDKILTEIINEINIDTGSSNHINNEQELKLIEHINKMKPKLIKYKTIDELHKISNSLSMYKLKKHIDDKS